MNMMEKNLKFDKLLQTDTKNNDIIKEGKKTKLEYNAINSDLAHMYGSW